MQDGATSPPGRELATHVGSACMYAHAHANASSKGELVHRTESKTTPAESTPLPISLVVHHLMHIKLTPSSEGLGSGSARPAGFRTQLHVTTSLSTGGGPMSYVHLSEEGFQVVYLLGLWYRFSGVVQVQCRYGQ